MSYRRSLLNPPSAVAQGETLESLLNPIPGRLPIDEHGLDSVVGDSEPCSIESWREEQEAA